MKITCSVEKLKNAVILAERMTGKNLTLPVLHCIMLSAQGDILTVQATNLGVGVAITLPATIEEEGSVIVKGDILANVCNNSTQQENIILFTENDNIVIQSAKTKTLIKSVADEEFPSLPTVEGDRFEIKNNILQEGIRSVYFAAAVSDIKPEIASIFIYSENETVYFVATDSFRLAEKKFSVKGFPDIPKILLPYKNIADVLRALDALGDTVAVSYTRNQVSFTGNGIYFTSRLIDGGFPAYQMILPKEENTKIVLMKQDLLTTLRLSTVFADKFFQVALTADTDQKKVSISSKNTDVGSSVTMVDAVLSGESIEVVFNLKYFMDVFQALSGDSISISFTKSNKPIVIRSVNDTSFLYLLMPTNR